MDQLERGVKRGLLDLQDLLGHKVNVDQLDLLDLQDNLDLKGRKEQQDHKGQLVSKVKVETGEHLGTEVILVPLVQLETEAMWVKVAHKECVANLARLVLLVHLVLLDHLGVEDHKVKLETQEQLDPQEQQAPQDLLDNEDQQDQ